MMNSYSGIRKDRGIFASFTRIAQYERMVGRMLKAIGLMEEVLGSICRF